MYKDGLKKLLNSNQNIKEKKYKGFLYEFDISFIFNNKIAWFFIFFRTFAE